jgi:hypothetical protein
MGESECQCETIKLGDQVEKSVCMYAVMCAVVHGVKCIVVCMSECEGRGGEW